MLKRFYLTLMLYKIINEHSFWDVANTFDIPRGFIQSLFSSSTSFASCLVHFTKVIIIIIIMIMIMIMIIIIIMIMIMIIMALLTFPRGGSSMLM